MKHLAALLVGLGLAALTAAKDVTFTVYDNSECKYENKKFEKKNYMAITVGSGDHECKPIDFTAWYHLVDTGPRPAFSLVTGDHIEKATGDNIVKRDDVDLSQIVFFTDVSCKDPLDTLEDAMNEWHRVGGEADLNCLDVKDPRGIAAYQVAKKKDTS
ncbi:Uu.00g003550.m01.CDS01 [Anthostomella pinea]|uniref:Uu.00g003550.m01.CDS01 n=1 Tax=Anthostomella pinea TaxID=933095 RepID=A0AAI8YIQ0_9PEZI|nr:Uu.00g003550.m01.CDS01 [Anthostomella pinea]